jgi:hypothetical protein
MKDPRPAYLLVSIAIESRRECCVSGCEGAARHRVGFLVHGDVVKLDLCDRCEAAATAEPVFSVENRAKATPAKRAAPPRSWAPWTDADLEVLREMDAARCGPTKIATRLGRTVEAVIAQRARLRQLDAAALPLCEGMDVSAAVVLGTAGKW